MKLTSYAILFLVIVFPFLMLSGIKARLYHEDEKLRFYYDQILDNAVGDAAFIWAQYQKKADRASDTSDAGAREVAALTFLDSLYGAFGANGSPSAMARLNACVPILLFFEEEGFSVYALTEYAGSGGHSVITHCWYPICPYTGEIASDLIVRYTLSDRVYVYDRRTQQESIGLYADLSAQIPSFGSREQFELLRQSAVTKSIEKALKSHITRFNALSGKMGITYTFHFPRLDEGDWERALIDEGLLVFAQGLPVVSGGQYEMKAFGGARILRRPNLAGYTRDGILTYCKEECPAFQGALQNPQFEPESLRYFTTPRQAAEAGYYPCPECRP